MLDLLNIFAPHLPLAQSSSLFSATASSTMLEHSDATVQKKSYRLLNRLIESGKIAKDGKVDALDKLVTAVNSLGGTVGAGAQRVNQAKAPRSRANAPLGSTSALVQCRRGLTERPT